MVKNNLFIYPSLDEIYLRIKDKNDGWEKAAKEYWANLYQNYQ